MMTAPPATPSTPSAQATPALIGFYFDFSCPYAYLASLQLPAIACRSGRDVELRPFLLGGVFAALGQAQNLTTTLSAPKQRYNRADLLRQAAWIGAKLRTPVAHPQRTVDALRALLCCPPALQPQVMASFFAAYWQDAEPIAEPSTLRGRLDSLGLDGAAILAEADGPAAREALRVATERALAAGVFGAPAFDVDGALYWGADRVELVIHAARSGWRPDVDAHGAPLTFDFAAGQTPGVAHTASPGAVP